ncbi:MAG: PIG-L family deacetylase [Bacteroidetes bacterium]|nr:MAG: PIG-L family deacetylase [Bacteroidota bacterium]
MRVVGSVLYVAAHPDDENTRLIAYLAQGKGYRTRYLSLTRGDGGQNLIGDEKGPALGLLRTQELLAARRVDGATQRFSRAYDFGYSKGPEETLAIWDKEAVLADVVRAIRTFRPDVIITRFATPEKGGGGHGHHTASAMLAHEAFALAGDPNAFPEQLESLKPWQPKRLLWNNYWVFRRYQPSEEEKKGIVTVDIGAYDPLLGQSYGEIASTARSMHRCQAFGTARYRGSLEEYLEFELGEPIADGELFSGIETSWNRLPGGAKVGKLLDKAYEKFNPSRPGEIVPVLLEAYRALAAAETMAAGQPDAHWYATKREDLQALIAYCAGLWFEVHSSEPIVALGDSLTLTARYIKRGEVAVKLERAQLGDQSLAPQAVLGNNGEVQELPVRVSTRGLTITQPYWLVEPQEKGLFTVAQPDLIGLPETPPAIMAELVFEIEGQSISFSTPVVHRYVDRAVGELYRPLAVSPPVTANIGEKVYLFSTSEPQEVDLRLRNFAPGTRAEVSFVLPDGWQVTPSQLTVDFDQVGEERPARVMVRPPDVQSVGPLQVQISVDGKTWTQGFAEIAYDHIPTQVYFPPAEARLVRVDLEKRGERVAYLMGSGDEIPRSLVQVGYQVDLLEDDQVTESNLMQYDAVIAGIRAYNVRKRMPFLQEEILKYVAKGGTYIVQYNTTYDISTDQPGPYPLQLSRERVTVEEAPMEFLQPDHPLLHGPNQITAADFDGWIQERGLYFPNEWDDRYEALFSSHDPGEDPLHGSLLVAKYGEGYFVYTGLSFFRELPAGVPGAYRLFTNMISLGQTEE